MNISAMLERSWETSFSKGIITPVKKRHCNECKGEVLCITCINQVNENKEFKANLILIKRHAPNEYGHMLPYYKG